MYSLPKAHRNLPTHAEFSEFISTILPPHPRDVQSIYHQPRHPHYDPAKSTFQNVILSITPTTGFYQKVRELSEPKSSVIRRSVCFLHRPFDLNRKVVPRGVFIQASHKRFDELLTVGWNEALAHRLDLSHLMAVCIQGYKGDPERRIGLVAPFAGTLSQSLGGIHAAVLREFGVGDIVPTMVEGPNMEAPIRGIAIMNAFGPDEVTRAVECAVQHGIIPEGGHSSLLYLTGEPKDLGVAALKEQYEGMFAICVGHRPAEEWGIKYLAMCIQQQFHIDVHVVLEDEEPLVERRPTMPSTQATNELSQDTRS